MPLLVVAEFKTLDEAIKEANDTEYSLTAGNFSEDKKEIAKFTGNIQFGRHGAGSGGSDLSRGWVNHPLIKALFMPSWMAVNPRIPAEPPFLLASNLYISHFETRLGS